MARSSRALARMAIAFGMTTRIAFLLPLLASLATACRPSEDAGARTDSAGLTAGPPLTAMLGGACSAMTRVTRATLRIATGRDRATSFPAPGKSSATWQGCRLVGSGAVPADSGVAARSAQLQAALSNDGWTLDPQYAESTPVASEFAVRRVSALCVVSMRSAGAAPAQAAPTAAPARTNYRLEIRCTENVPPRS